MKMFNKRSTGAFLSSVLLNLCLAMAMASVCRIVFFLLNKSLYPDVDVARLAGFCLAGLRFDTSSVLYANLLYILLMLIPFRFRAYPAYQRVAKIVFVAFNFLCVFVDLVDSVYFPFTGRRTTAAFFQEFSGDDNLGKIFFHEALSHWYLVLLAAGILWVLIKGYRQPAITVQERYGWTGYLVHVAIFLGVLYPLVGGLRGGFGVTVRPIGINDANLYVEKPVETAVVLNTTFSMIRTLESAPFFEPHWFATKEELEAEYTPVHTPDSTALMRKKNVVVLILESFSASYSSYLTGLQGEKKEGYMPFLDSLMQESLIFRHSFANGRLSIDAQPSVVCSVPALIESFTLTPYANNDVRGLAAELADKGYSSGFWHGAQRQSLALAGFAHKTGTQKEFSREDYGNEADFDGTWGIWDEPFLQYFEKGIGRLSEPFVATVFTLSSHHPYNIPAAYDRVFQAGTMPIHRSIRYSDYALRKFFEAARREPWYENTLFVITGDHTSQTDNPEYMTLNGVFTIPILYYTPDGSLSGLREGVTEQLDIKPTVLGYLGYDRPYVGFGCNLLETADEDTYAIHYQSGIFCYYQDGYQLQFDGEKVIALYAFTQDRLLAHNLMESQPERVAAMERRVKAIIQQFTHRLIHNELVVRQ